MELLKLKEAVKKIALDSGADLVGIGSKERLDGNPPSTDMEYSLPGAKSCIIWAYANPIDGLEKYFSKTERMSMKVAQDKGYVTGWQTAEKMVEFIEKNTEFKADPVVPNMKYRSGTQNILGGEAFPPFSLRYGAVSAGLGHIGWSGNLVTSEYGASLYLNGVITTAPLEADPMAEKNNCNKCKICQNVCTTGYVSKGEAEDRQPVIIGGIKQIYGKRGIFMKCGISCAGFTGLSEDGTWSTWSANSENGLCLKKIPENEWDEDFIVQKMRDLTRSKNTPRILRKYNQRIGGNFGNTLVIANTGLRPIEQTNPVCANCNFICVADPKKRVELYNLLKKSGKVFLDEKGQEFVKKFDENGKEITYYPPTWEEYKKANMIE